MKIDFRAMAVLIFLLTCQSVEAATASGISALALASLVAVHSPVVSTGDAFLIRRLFSGHFHELRGDTKVISVEADAIVCSVGNVDLTSHSCKLTFDGKTVNLTGRGAYELYAAMSQAGVPAQGSAGKLHENLSHLVCTIKPLEIAKRNGGGADCTFDAAASPAAKIKPIACIGLRPNLLDFPNKICGGVLGDERGKVFAPRPCQSVLFISMLKLAAKSAKSTRTKQTRANKSCASGYSLGGVCTT